MPKMIFVNLPVTDLARSIAFYEAVGAVRDDRFADDTAQCMTFSQSIHVMLLTHEKFRGFTTLTIADPRQTAHALLSLSEDSREAVNATIRRALVAGGGEPHPIEDNGFMLSGSFSDPDGHGWGVMWMDLDAFLAMGDAAHGLEPAA